MRILIVCSIIFAMLVVGCGSSAPAPTAAPTIARTVTTARTTTAPAQPTLAPTVTSAPAPTATLARPTTAPPSPTVAPTAASINYNGEWQGVSAKDSPLSFEIEENEMRHLNVNYVVESGACQFLSGSRGGTKMNPPFAVVKSKDIDIQLDFGEGYSLVLTGAFTSNTEASGKLIFKGNSRACGAFEINTTWSAKRSAASASSSSASPTTAPAKPSAGDAELEKALRAFFDALNAKQVDAALALVDDNVVFNIGVTTTGLGKAQLRTYLQAQINRGVTYTVSEVKADDDEVTFSLKTGAGAVTTDNSITFDDGKMDFIVWQ